MADATKAMRQICPDRIEALTSIKDLVRILPGLLLCVAVAAVAMLLQMVEVGLAGQPYLEALVIAILLGVAIRTAWTPGQYWSSGIQFSAKILLEIAVVLLGASVSASAAAALGPCIATRDRLHRGGRHRDQLRHLQVPRTAVANVDFGGLRQLDRGNSAIAAVAPVIGAVCLSQIKSGHIHDAVRPGLGDKECARRDRRRRRPVHLSPGIDACGLHCNISCTTAAGDEGGAR
jgi:Conserved hypothetical protein 698